MTDLKKLLEVVLDSRLSPPNLHPTDLSIFRLPAEQLGPLDWLEWAVWDARARPWQGPSRCYEAASSPRRVSGLAAPAKPYKQMSSCQAQVSSESSRKLSAL